MARTEPPSDLTHVGVLFSYSLYDREREGADAAPEPHKRLEAFFTTLSVRHYFGQGWSADLIAPIGLIVEGERRVSGLGDLQIGMQYDFGAIWGLGGYRPSLTLSAGLGLPTGTRRISNESEAMTEGDVVPVTLLGIGAGAFISSFRLDYIQPLHPMVVLRMPLGVSVPLARNDSSLMFGVGFDAGLGVVVFPVSGLSISAQTTFRMGTQSNESGAGVVVNSGGEWLSAELSISGKITDGLSLGVRGIMPLWERVEGRQITQTFTAMLTANYAFGDDDGGDDDDDEETVEGEADVADLSTGGQAFDEKKAAVAGKITVVDFWADW